MKVALSALMLLLSGPLDASAQAIKILSHADVIASCGGQGWKAHNECMQNYLRDPCIHVISKSILEDLELRKALLARILNPMPHCDSKLAAK